MEAVKPLFMIFVPFVVTLGIVRRPAPVLMLYKLFLLSFVWYSVLGIPTVLTVGVAAAYWDPEFGNPDAFGPLGVMGDSARVLHRPRREGEEVADRRVRDREPGCARDGRVVRARASHQQWCAASDLAAR